MEMDALLEMVASAVRNDSRIDDVKLAYAPGVESRLGKQLLEHPIIADLNIAAAHSQASHIACGGQSSGVTVVKDPAKAGRFTISAVDIHQLDVGEAVENTDTNLKRCAMGPIQGSGIVANNDLQIPHTDMRSEMFQNLVFERKLLAEWNGCDLREIVTHRGCTQELVIAVPDNASHLHFEEALRRINGRNAAKLHNLGNCLAQLMMLFT